MFLITGFSSAEGNITTESGDLNINPASKRVNIGNGGRLVLYNETGESFVEMYASPTGQLFVNLSDNTWFEQKYIRGMNLWTTLPDATQPGVTFAMVHEASIGGAMIVCLEKRKM